MDGVLRYFTASSSSAAVAVASDSEAPAGINMSSGAAVDDGQWHRVSLEVDGDAVRLKVDGEPAGYELERSAAHDFLDPASEEFVLGGEGEEGEIQVISLNVKT